MFLRILAVALVLTVAGTQSAKAQPQSGPPFQTIDREGDGIFVDWTEQGFTSMDRNRDNRITEDEWTFDPEAFRRADHNRDGVVARREFLNEDEDRDDKDNRNANRNGNRNDRFADLDVNKDNRISRSEWHGTRANFDLLDDNRDGRVTRAEVLGSEPAAKRSPGYQAGHDRGLIEGRAAGREDGERNRWDLDGQRELEQADSGYEARKGSRADYQTAYRAAFRAAYREGFERR